MLIDMKAIKKWNKMPKDVQVKFTNNVFCSNCGVTTIIDYSIADDKFGVLLSGKCKKCGRDVARLIDIT